MKAKPHLETPERDSCQSVLFVCWGNLCRSPAAAFLLRRELKRLGVQGFEVESAGVCPDDKPTKPTWPMRWASFRRGVWLRPRPRRFTKRDFKLFDLLIAMDREVLFAMRNIGNQESEKVKLLSEFLPEGSPIDVPDPMRRSVSVCNRVFDLLELACTRICQATALPQETSAL